MCPHKVDNYKIVIHQQVSGSIIPDLAFPPAMPDIFLTL
jgi:hypothetical protein